MGLLQSSFVSANETILLCEFATYLFFSSTDNPPGGWYAHEISSYADNYTYIYNDTLNPVC